MNRAIAVAVPRPGPALASPTPSRLEEFTELQKLGKGSFGSVTRVQRRTDGKAYAMKSIALRALRRVEIKDALNEALLLSRLRHPNIVRYHEAFIDESKMDLCIVMEYADGGDLTGKIEACAKAGKRIAEVVIWGYLFQLLEGIRYLHRRHLMHRDVKSANCFLSSSGRLKLGDLNVSKVSSGPAGLLKTQIGGCGQCLLS